MVNTRVCLLVALRPSNKLLYSMGPEIELGREEEEDPVSVALEVDALPLGHIGGHWR